MAITAHHKLKRCFGRGMLLCLLPVAATGVVADIKDQEPQPGFSFDCDNTSKSPCKQLVARDREKGIRIESSSAAWSERYRRVIVVSDNYNDLSEQGAGHYVIAYFDPADKGMEIEAQPLLTPAQAEAFRLFDLEGVTLDGDQLYAIGSLALHGKNSSRDRWERHQLVSLELKSNDGQLEAQNLSHVSERWPNFRDWILSKSGYEWTGEKREAGRKPRVSTWKRSAQRDAGHLMIGFRGPTTAAGGALALEIQLPASVDGEPILIDTHKIPPVDLKHIPAGATTEHSGRSALSPAYRENTWCC